MLKNSFLAAALMAFTPISLLADNHCNCCEKCSCSCEEDCNDCENCDCSKESCECEDCTCCTKKENN